MSYFKYAISNTHRRKLLDRAMIRNRAAFRPGSTVLDIGGRDRGFFKKPKSKVGKWIFADIQAENKPDIVLDVADMKSIQSGSIDTVLANELFEHVAEPERGLNECYRILKAGGELILSVPFLYPVHGDPYDFQRWTETKWSKELSGCGFREINIEILGRFFSVLATSIKIWNQSLPSFFRYLLYPVSFAFDLLAGVDNTDLVKKNTALSRFHGGYFIIAKK
ncbi:class I SAM-dependent methyltransferase [Candidatus Falkowbacteria bacterium]|nr:class I SAM-dependent methyltransferase [Candidatus Falkowbacteria bacterium]